MKRITNKLSFKVLSYLVLFSIVILLILWLLQIVSFGSYYELSVRRDIEGVGDKVKGNYNNNDYLNRLSFENDMCIEIYEGSSLKYSAISCNRDAAQLTKEKRNFINSNQEEGSFELEDKRFNSKLLTYGFKLDNNKFAFIQVRLEPVDSTVTILKSQLIIVIVVVLILSILVALFISRRISKPIEKINNNAKKLAKGEYDLDFDDKSTITEIKELNETLNYTSQELGKTESLRREFMSNVSHDLKTPLTMIKAYAEMVRDLDKDKMKRETDLNVIIEESDRLNLLVNDILDLSKYQAKTIVIEKEEFDLNQLILEIINRYSIYQERDGYTIKYKKQKKCVVEADRKRIEQVIYNLLNNAINYSGEDKIINIDLKIDDSIARVEITNSGEGIKEEELDLIWDKYYKIDKTYSRVQVGTGIGLSIVKNILELHNFKYGVSSKLGKSTTFYFEIPIKEK